jgi:hypothetical protein
VSGLVFTHDAVGTLVPLGFATVTMRSGELEFVASTDASGRYTMWVDVATYAVTVEADGYESLTDSGIQADPSGLNYTAVLEPMTADVPRPDRPRIALRGSIPDPVARTSWIHFSLATAGRVDLRLYDVLGREAARLAGGWMPAGDHAAAFEASGLPRGRYFLVLRQGAALASRPMTLLR